MILLGLAIQDNQNPSATYSATQLQQVQCVPQLSTLPGDDLLSPTAG